LFWIEILALLVGDLLTYAGVFAVQGKYDTERPGKQIKIIFELLQGHLGSGKPPMVIRLMQIDNRMVRYT
jgi:hypothetical protein